MKRRRMILPNIYIFLILAILYIPVLILMAYSFNSNAYGAAWGGFTFDWYNTLFQRADVQKAVVTTLIVTSCSTVISIVIATLCAIGFYRYDFKGKNFLNSFLYLPAIVPPIVLGVALYMFYNFANVTMGIGTIMLAHVTFCAPYAFTTIKSTLDGFDRSIEEAALDLGCSQMQVIWKVLVPVIMPGIISSALICITLSIDDVMTSYFVCGSSGQKTLSMLIYSLIKGGVKPDINALSTILVLFSVTIGVLTQFTGKRRKGRSGKSGN
jgi:spermidine/putrescine transport system permease protein